MNSSPLSQSIDQTLARLQDSGVDVEPLRAEITERLENKALQVFLSQMTPDQLTHYKTAIDSADPETIERVSSEIAIEMPGLAPTLEKVMEAEYQQIVTELAG